MNTTCASRTCESHGVAWIQLPVFVRLFMLLHLPPNVITRKAERQRLRIQVSAVCAAAGLSEHAVRRIERGQLHDPATVARYVVTVDAMAAAVRDSLAKLDELAAAGVRSMTFGELADALTGGHHEHE